MTIFARRETTGEDGRVDGGRRRRRQSGGDRNDGDGSALKTIVDGTTEERRNRRADSGPAIRPIVFHARSLARSCPSPRVHERFHTNERRVLALFGPDRRPCTFAPFFPRPHFFSLLYNVDFWENWSNGKKCAWKIGIELEDSCLNARFKPS